VFVHSLAALNRFPYFHARIRGRPCWCFDFCSLAVSYQLRRASILELFDGFSQFEAFRLKAENGVSMFHHVSYEEMMKTRHKHFVIPRPSRYSTSKFPRVHPSLLRTFYFDTTLLSNIHRGNKYAIYHHPYGARHTCNFEQQCTRGFSVMRRCCIYALLL
jgi:hypothetical protein